MKKFENFDHSDIDPLGEEIWDDNEYGNYLDLSEKSYEDIVKTLRDIALNNVEPLLVFHYTKLIIYDVDYGKGDTIDEVKNVILGEDGEIIIVCTRMFYDEASDEDVEDEVYYTLDESYDAEFILEDNKRIRIDF